MTRKSLQLRKSCWGRHAAFHSFAAAFVLLGAGCIRQPVRIGPSADVPARFSRSGEAAPVPEWWTAFGDEHLDALIAEALSGNFSLRAAWDRLDQACALAMRSGADLRPSLDASGGASRQVFRNLGTEHGYVNSFSLGLTASYEVDLWGRVRAARDANVLGASATEQDVQATAISLSAEIALAYFQLIEYTGQLRVIDEQLKTNEHYLEVITLRFRRGQASATDVLQQRQLVESTRGGRVQILSTIDVLRHQLAILLGRDPAGSDIPTSGKLPESSPLPRTGVPAEWLQGRPDLRAAALRVEAADRDLAAAIADRFPRLSLTAQASTTSEDVQRLFDNWLASLAANLTAPLVDGGHRRAEVDRTRAAASEALNNYRQAVLTAVGEVEDALVQEAHQQEYVASLERQLELSAEATEQVRQSYIRTGTNFIRYLTTLTSHQNLERTLLQSKRQRLGFRVNLYRALGGAIPLERPGAESR